MAEAETAAATRQRQAVRVDAVAALIDELAGTGLDDADFDTRVRVIRDLGLSVVAGPAVWTLEWSLPVGDGCESDLHVAADLADVAAPTAAEREADAAFRASEDAAVRRGEAAAERAG